MSLTSSRRTSGAEWGSVGWTVVSESHHKVDPLLNFAGLINFCNMKY